MIQLNPEKVAKLHSTNELLDKKYGKRGTASREAFQEKAFTWYYCEILKERRKELKLTQKELADRVGKERSYIAYVESGKTDVQVSSLVRIANALGFSFELIPRNL
ncbi:MAG: helix-turn-helix transcriptional regulator [Clostridiales bacterium]|jgi:ribosome-binding protein aMBF1 (putative translation factor)|nr:helix-turn-helix transcriptional regulator [Clostridiales bacterium]